MTDFDAATAKQQMRSAQAALFVIAMGVGLAGCGSSGNIFGGDQLATQSAAPVAGQQAQQAQQVLAAVALAPIIGPPDELGKLMRSHVEQAGQANRITILPDRDPKANYGMRGYIVASRDRGAVKVSYIWDVTDPAGKRVNRITGEETAAAAAGSKDPWAAVTPVLSQTIANKVASSLASWVPSQTQQPAAGVPVASAVGAGASALAAPQSPPVSVAPAVASAQATTATTASLPVTQAVVPTGPIVRGAPGDGNAALARALQRELVRQGVDLAKQSSGYNVEGTVSVGAVQDGKQPIRIDWRVKDAKGASVGTVTQRNAIPPGSLDGEWGKTADAAAAAAAQGIIKLLPKGGAAGNG